MTVMKIIRPDSEDQTIVETSVTVFLAGTIDNGAVEPWAHKVAESFDPSTYVTFFDPRRENWNAGLENRAHVPEFRAQVEWELARIDSCDIPFFNFVGGSLSPITLQELGYVLGTRMGETIPRELPIVVCPDDFWRKGNVEIMCERVGEGLVEVFNTLDDGIAALRAAIKRADISPA